MGKAQELLNAYLAADKMDRMMQTESSKKLKELAQNELLNHVMQGDTYLQIYVINGYHSIMKTNEQYKIEKYQRNPFNSYESSLEILVDTPEFKRYIKFLDGELEKPQDIATDKQISYLESLVKTYKGRSGIFEEALNMHKQGEWITKKKASQYIEQLKAQ